MEATGKEVELSKVACLLDELDGKPLEPSHWRGYHPAVYSREVDADAIVSELCRRLQTVEVTKQSLEMQMWWRDHQAADKARLEHEMARNKTGSEREAALSKLTEYERELLGIGT
jgi:hypothetical protein